MRAYHILPHILPLFLLGLSPVMAATPAVPIDQRIKHIEVQDAAVRIDELRVGGETQTITVKPTNGLPAYEVVPANGARNRTLDGRDGGQGSVGSRSWKLLNF